MANVHILEAANNLIKAAASKRDEKNQVLAQLDAYKRNVDKQLSQMSAQLKIETDRATRGDSDAQQSATATRNAQQLHKEMDELKRQQSQQVQQQQKTAEQLEQQAQGFESEAKTLQSQA